MFAFPTTMCAVLVCNATITARLIGPCIIVGEGTSNCLSLAGCSPESIRSSTSLLPNYVGNPKVENVLSDYQAGLASVETAVAQVQAVASFNNKLKLEIPGLLDRTDAKAKTPCSQLENLLDANAALTQAGFVSVDAGDVDQPYEIGDYYDNGEIDFSDLLHQFGTNSSPSRSRRKSAVSRDA